MLADVVAERRHLGGPELFDPFEDAVPACVVACGHLPGVLGRVDPGLKVFDFLEDLGGGGPFGRGGLGVGVGGCRQREGERQNEAAAHGWA